VRECLAEAEILAESGGVLGELVQLSMPVSTWTMNVIIAEDSLFPSLTLRSFGGWSPPLSGCSDVAEAVNHVRDTEAWRARTSVMVRWYCFRPSSRGAVKQVEIEDGS
jgi:hypothetical protein